jgi:uncharacterized membrane protein YfcA
MSLPILFSNGWQVWRYRANIRTGISFLPWLLVGSVVGIVFGTWLLTALPQRALSLALAVLVLAYIGLRIRNPEFTISIPLARRLSPAVGFAAGTLQGAAGVSAPVTITFMHSLRLPRAEYIGIISCIFIVPTLVQFPALWIADVLTWHRLLESALALVPVAVLMPAGAWMARFISRTAFDWIILGVLGIIAIELLVKGIGA